MRYAFGKCNFKYHPEDETPMRPNYTTEDPRIAEGIIAC
jgi:hypothetical protein